MGRIAGLVLAAGGSSRMGHPKQLLELRGRPMVQHAVATMAAAGLTEVVVVVGHAAADVVMALHPDPPVRVVANPGYREGLASSLQAGLGSLDKDVDAAVVVLADQPAVQEGAIRAVVSVFGATPRPIVVATYGGRRGHPVLLARDTWPELMALRGDSGAREVMQAHPHWVGEVELGGEPPMDVDTEADYTRILQAMSSP